MIQKTIKKSCRKQKQELKKKKSNIRTEKVCEFSGSPVVRTQHLHYWGPHLKPGWGTKMPQDSQCGQKKKGISKSQKFQNKETILNVGGGGGNKFQKGMKLTSNG